MLEDVAKPSQVSRPPFSESPEPSATACRGLSAKRPPLPSSKVAMSLAVPSSARPVQVKAVDI